MGSMTTLQTDCLILGGGLAGWMAAREAAAAGLKTMLLHDGMALRRGCMGLMCPYPPKIRQTSFCRIRWRAGRGSAIPLWPGPCARMPPRYLTRYAPWACPSTVRRMGSYQALRPLAQAGRRVVSIGNETGAAILTR